MASPTASFVTSFASQLVEPLAGLASAGVAWLCAWAARWVFTKTKNEQVRAGMLRLDDAIMVAVREVQQTVVETMKKQTADGKLTAADAAAVREAAISTVKAHFQDKGLADLQKVLGVSDLQVMLTARIEAAVQQTKASAVVPAPGK